MHECSGFSGEKSLQTSQLKSANAYLCQKNFFIHSKQKKKELLVIFLIYLVLSDDLGKKKKRYFFPNFVVSRFEENSIINLVWPC